MEATRAAAVLGTTLLLIGAAFADGDPVRGESRFKDCAACHKLDAGSNGLGPSLHGIFERKAGELADFRYSPAMKRIDIVWDEPNLKAYLANPQAKVSGNRMSFSGLPNPADIEDVVAYLQSFK